ncbi:MAG: ABC transporter ATP-binding protein [Promethearchaeota archaeon]
MKKFIIKSNELVKDNHVAIEVKNLQKYFEDVRAVDGISFQVMKGECFGFLGPNGAGKTTTINMLSCYLKPTSGIAKVENFNVDTQDSEVKKHIGICTQENIFYNELTVYENLIFFGKMYAIDSKTLKSRVIELIKKVGLEQKRKIKAEK